MIELVEYDPAWPQRFARAADEIRGALGPVALAVEHIGSTALPGALAKPSIDLAVQVESFDLLPARYDCLARAGFRRLRRQPAGHRVLVRETAGERTEIAHFFRSDGWEHCSQRLFRDWLLTHADDLARYLTVKAQAAAAATTVRDYTARKAAVVHELTNKARAQYGLAPLSELDH